MDPELEASLQELTKSLDACDEDGSLHELMEQARQRHPYTTPPRNSSTKAAGTATPRSGNRTPPPPAPVETPAESSYQEKSPPPSSRRYEPASRPSTAPRRRSGREGILKQSNVEDYEDSRGAKHRDSYRSDAHYPRVHDVEDDSSQTHDSRRGSSVDRTAYHSNRFHNVHDDAAWNELVLSMQDTMDRQELLIERLQRQKQELLTECARLRADKSRRLSSQSSRQDEYRAPRGRTPPRWTDRGRSPHRQQQQQQARRRPTRSSADRSTTHLATDENQFSPGTKFVAELSQVMHLEPGYHAPLSLILDKHWERVAEIRQRHQWK